MRKDIFESPTTEKKFNWNNVRTLVSFWIIGLTNNFGYVVMLSSAHDIMKDFDDKDEDSETIKSVYRRKCNVTSTGAILLADILPSIIVKLFAPFFPLCINIRIFIAVLFSAAGFFFVAIRIHKWVVIFGVACTAIGMGLGESSYLGFMPFFKNPNVISTWSSGTGAAGLFGSFSYAAFIAIGISPSTTIMIMIISPLTMGLCFWLLLPHPEMKMKETDKPAMGEEISVKDKLIILPHLTLYYTAPFSFVYLFEYFINQGLFELLYFPKTFLDHHSQYRWYQVLYQTGVFISRSSMNIIQIDYLWLLAILQGVNVVALITEVLVGYFNYLAFCMVYILWEGLIGGASYVNTYRRIEKEFPHNEREFSMAMNSFGDSVMITFSGFIALPVHDILCRTNSPYE